MKRSRLLAVFAIAMSLAGQEQPQPNWRVKFEQFPVEATFKGKPAPAKIVSKSDRLFRTRIREGAREGSNFAGHYTLVKWGCGSGCVSFRVVDAKTGTVYPAPFAFLFVPYQGTKSGREYVGLVYRTDSRLLIADGCPQDGECGSLYLKWNGTGFRRIRFESQPELTQ